MSISINTTVRLAALAVLLAALVIAALFAGGVVPGRDLSTLETERGMVHGNILRANATTEVAPSDGE